jgi:gamma-D-glutamyl-L-lysine dipeptidyl-peptidase
LKILLFLLFLTCSLHAEVYVNKPVSTLYASADQESAPVSQAIYGTLISQYSADRGWSLVETPDGYLGWLRHADLLERDCYEPTARVKVLYSHLYPSPAVTQQPRITLAFGTELELMSVEEGQRWLPVRLLDGQELYIQRGDVEFDLKPLTLDEMLAACHQFLGLPYTWGGTTSFGFDCSGFAQAMYRLVGVELPRDAWQQGTCGVLVTKSEIEPGDLLFFGADRIIHVAIYLGDQKIIHAAANIRFGSPVVRIDKLSDEEMVYPFLCARRI